MLEANSTLTSAPILDITAKFDHRRNPRIAEP